MSVNDRWLYVICEGALHPYPSLVGVFPTQRIPPPDGDPGPLPVHPAGHGRWYICDAYRVQWGSSCGMVYRNPPVRFFNLSAPLRMKRTEKLSNLKTNCIKQ